MYKQSKPFQLSRKGNVSFSNTQLVQRGPNPHAEPQEWIHASLSHPSSLQEHHHEGSQGAAPAGTGTPGWATASQSLQGITQIKPSWSTALPKPLGSPKPSHEPSCGEPAQWQHIPSTGVTEPFPAQRWLNAHRGCTDVQSPTAQQDLVYPPQSAARQAQQTRAKCSSKAKEWDTSVSPEVCC